MKPRRALLFCILVIFLASCSPGGNQAGQANPPQVASTDTVAVSSSLIPASPTPVVSASPTSAVVSTAPAGNEPQVGSESDARIDAALDQGKLDAETALVYKVYAQFNDARLPSEYQGKTNLHTDSHIIDQVQAQFSSLSPQAKANLLPYLVPPIYQGSWAPPASGGEGVVDQINLPCSQVQVDQWDSLSAMHSPVRFWWLKSRPEDASIANNFLVSMDDEIWPKLTALMGRTPLADSGSPCNGGGPEFDIYITAQIGRSYAAAYFPPGCRETPSYIVMNPSVSNAILAHEFMHAIQWSYNTSADCMYPGNYAWLAEATASWAQDYVYPDSNEEHGYIPWFYDNKGASQPPALDLRNDSHEYGANIFFFYLTHNFDNPQLVRTAWDNTTSMKSLDAVDKAIPGGLAEVWGDFAVKNVVEPPYDEYQIWDQLNLKPSSSSLVKDKLATNNTYVVADKINALAIKYEWYSFSEDSRLVTFFNGLTYQLDDEPINTYVGVLPIKDGTKKYKFTPLDPKDVDGVKIQAYFKVAGDTDWQLEDWTNKPYVSFCRDADAERLTDLIVITSNSSQDTDYSQAGAYESRLEVSDLGCWRYGGSASLQSTGQGEGGAYTDNQNIPNVAFERTDVHPNIPYPYLHFKVVEGQWDRAYDYKSTDGDCVGNGKTNTGLGNQTSSDLFVFYGLVSGPSVRRYSGTANSNQSVGVNFRCPDGNPSSSIPPMPFFSADILSQIREKVYSVPTGGVIDGSDDLLGEIDNAKMAYQWHFEPLAEPAGGQASASGSGGSESSSSNPGTGGSGSPQSPNNASVPGVPDYPNAQFSQQPASGTLMIMTTDPGDQVAEFYKTQLTGLGWTEIPGQSGSSGAMLALSFSKENEIIAIIINSQDGQTSILINKLNQ